MFNPERLLGGLLRSGLRRRSGLEGLVTGGALLGLAGVAMEAVSHYMNKAQAPPDAASAPSAAPPPGPEVTTSPAAVPPPPPPGGGAIPQPPGGTSAAVPHDPGDAILLIRAMIAAANADGIIDAAERTAIFDKLKQIQPTDEEHQFIAHELLEPKPMQAIIAAVTSPEMARQVYLVSLLAIEIDSDEEIDYLCNLAQGLGLDAQAIAAAHQQAGVDLDFE